jgi:membrane protein YdbS with pleckstrin-like domain
MEKRPLSLTIIGWLLVVFTLFGLYGLATMGSNPVATKMLEQMHVSLRFEQAWGLLGSVVNLVCAYGILKGIPWSRVLFVVWGVIGLVVGFYISPIKYVLVFSLVFIVVIAAFLWTNAANDWFQARGFMLKRERSR